MAAYYGHSAARACVSGGSSRLEQILLPNGACSFRDLAAGVQAPTCGCRRFWLNNTTGIDQGERAWCFCGHHACFHENVQPAQGRSQGQSPRSAINVFPSSHQANAQSQPGAWIPPTWSELVSEHEERNASNRGHTPAAAPGSATGLGIRNSHPPSQPRSINTTLWQALNGFARNQAGDGNSDLLSTAVPSLYDEPQNNRPMGPPVSIPPTNINENRMETYSATEVATPSIRGTPDFRAQQQPSGVNDPSPSRPPVRAFLPSQNRDGIARQDHASRVDDQNPSPSVPLSVLEISNTVQDLGRRINYLEGVSFSHMPSADVQEKFELVDGRLIDLEVWRGDQDRAEASNNTQDFLDRLDSRLQDVEDWRTDQENLKTTQESEAPIEASSSRLRRLLPIETGSFASDGSFDENAAAQTEAVVLATLAANAETGPRIDALESRITELENAALPTFARPWHVQVVLLPFGRELPGVWFSSTESTQRLISSGTQASEEWTGPPISSKASFRSVNSDTAWTTESIEAWAHETRDEWLSPKACGPSGTVFQRLASRGMVQDVVLQSPDARHICKAIASAFKAVLQTDESAATADSKYLGLKEDFIPLRKVRKSSRLRFLSRAEMITPAIWDAPLLESSVFMRVNDGERRLYVTTPEGYIQPPRSCWTWPALRGLPMYDTAGDIQQAQAAGNVVEACWSRNSQLDHTTSLPSSFTSSSEFPWGISSDSGGEDQIQEDAPMLSPSATRHSHVRSSSLPISEPAFPRNMVGAENLPKRRVASFEIEGSVAALEHSPEYVAKRRRISASPELERRGVNFTPRWSREPPSPYTADDVGATRSSQAASNRARGTTPFAYATPHSHYDSRAGDDGDGDTEVDDAQASDVSQSDDDVENGEEWEGVQEHARTNSERSFRGDHEENLIDEDNLADGMTIYEV